MAKRKVTLFRKSHLPHFKKLLNEERDKVLQDMGYIKETLDSSMRDSSGDHSAYSFHIADQGSDTYDRERTYLMAARENKYLGEIMDALERIETGSYGICVLCDKPIEKERLEVVPIAKYHVNCKEQLAKAKKKEATT